MCLDACRQLQHRRAMLSGRPVAGELERLEPGGHESQRVEPQNLERDLPDDQMAVVDGIERPAEESYPRTMRHRPCRRESSAICLGMARLVWLMRLCAPT